MEEVARLGGGVVQEVSGNCRQAERSRVRTVETRAGKQLVTRNEQLLVKEGFKVTTAVEQGDLRLGIVDYAAQWKADLSRPWDHPFSGPMARPLRESSSKRCYRDFQRPRASPHQSRRGDLRIGG